MRDGAKLREDACRARNDQPGVLAAFNNLAISILAGPQEHLEIRAAAWAVQQEFCACDSSGSPKNALGAGDRLGRPGQSPRRPAVSGFACA